MTKDFSIIIRGIAIAFLGFVATSLLILGLSGLFIGKWTASIGLLLGSLVSYSIFYRSLDPYLNSLEQRFEDSSSQT